MHDHFCVCFGAEHHALGFEFATQLSVILDDAVVHQHQTVAGAMRMRVVFARRTVRCPAGVRDTHGAAERRLLNRVDQATHFTHGTASM